MNYIQMFQRNWNVYIYIHLYRLFENKHYEDKYMLILLKVYMFVLEGRENRTLTSFGDILVHKIKT